MTDRFDLALVTISIKMNRDRTETAIYADYYADYYAGYARSEEKER